ncbi:MAG TPA: hypothetical protein VGE83_09595 [Terracidiphilus sp.]|jgi:hypothetical protein
MEHSQATVEKLRYDRKSAAFALSMSVRALDYRLASGEIETTRDGRQRYISASTLKRCASRNHFDGLTDTKQKREVA